MPGGALFRAVAFSLLPSGPLAQGLYAPPSRQPRQINPNASHSELSQNDPAIELLARVCSTAVQKRLASCMIRARRL